MEHCPLFLRLTKGEEAEKSISRRWRDEDIGQKRHWKGRETPEMKEKKRHRKIGRDTANRQTGDGKTELAGQNHVDGKKMIKLL